MQPISAGPLAAAILLVLVITSLTFAGNAGSVSGSVIATAKRI
jgi:hypothetical protein